MSARSSSPLATLWRWGRPHRGLFLASIFLAVLGVGCQMLPYFAISALIARLFSGSADLHTLTPLLLVVCGGYLGQVIFSNVSTLLSHTAAYHTLRDLRRRIADKLTRVPMGTVLATPSGSYKNLIVDRIEAMEVPFAHLLPEMTANVLVPLGILAYLFVLDWRLALLSLTTLVLGLVIMSIGMRNYAAEGAGALAASKRMANAVVEYISGIEVVKAFNQQAGSYKKYAKAVRGNADYYIGWMKKSQKTMCSYNAVLPSVLLTVLPGGMALWLSGSLDTATFMTAVVFSLGLVGPIMEAFSFSGSLAMLGRNVNEIASLLAAEELVHGDTPQPLHDHTIVLENVRFGYTPETEILHGINLTIPPGTMCALVGPSGSGKSTIAKLICGFWNVSAGSLTMGGQSLSALPLDEWSAQIAYVSQDNYLFNRSIRENIRMGRADASDAEVEAAAAACGCDAFIRVLPQGYETIVGHGGAQLSGGERQRIAICRAMLKDAPIVILDEATAYIDPENEVLVQQALSALTHNRPSPSGLASRRRTSSAQRTSTLSEALSLRNALPADNLSTSRRTLIVIAHRLSTITAADNIAVVSDGRILCQGTHERLLADCPLYAQLWQAHIGARDDV